MKVTRFYSYKEGDKYYILRDEFGNTYTVQDLWDGSRDTRALTVGASLPAKGAIENAILMFHITRALLWSLPICAVAYVLFWIVV